MSSKKKTVISKEVALKELDQFVNRFVKKPVPVDELEEGYPDILEAIMDGHLSFDGMGVPVLKLKDPIKNDKDEVSVAEITFKTRIRPTTLADIASGIDLKKDSLKLQLKMVSYIIDQPVAMLDRFERYDYDVINQIATVFS